MHPDEKPTKFKDGGKVKGKGSINIHIDMSKKETEAPVEEMPAEMTMPEMMPEAPPPAPPVPPMMGAPGAPPPFKRGGAVKGSGKNTTAGSGSGVGRLQKMGMKVPKA